MSRILVAMSGGVDSSVAAALLQSHLHALFRALVPAGQSLPELFKRANEEQVVPR